MLGVIEPISIKHLGREHPIGRVRLAVWWSNLQRRAARAAREYRRIHPIGIHGQIRLDVITRFIPYAQLLSLDPTAARTHQVISGATCLLIPVACIGIFQRKVVLAIAATTPYTDITRIVIPIERAELKTEAVTERLGHR